MTSKKTGRPSSTRSSRGKTDETAHSRSILGWTMAALALCALPQLVFKTATARRDLSVRETDFADAPPLDESERILVFAPHPDDETLATGGMIFQARQKKCAVRVVLLTNGDGSGSTRIGETWRQKKRPTYLQIAQMRQREATKALQQLGVSPDDIVFLGFPDGGLMQLWREHWREDDAFRSPFTDANNVVYENALSPNALYCGRNLLRDMARAIADFRPTRVVTTDGNDTHSDHRAAFFFALAALETIRLQSSTRLEDAPPNQAPPIAFWTTLIHHAIWPLPHGDFPAEKLSPPQSLLHVGADWKTEDLDAKTQAAKRAALECYESQMTWTPNYLRSFLRRNELFNLKSHAVSFSPSHTGTSLEATELLRDPMKDSLTRQLFPTVDLHSLSAVSPSPRETISLQIGTRAFASPRSIYTLQIHILNADIAQTRAVQIEVRWFGEKWRATFQSQSETQNVRVGESLDGLKIDVPLSLLGKSATVLLSARVRLGRKMLDETSTVAVRLRYSSERVESST